MSDCLSGQQSKVYERESKGCVLCILSTLPVQCISRTQNQATKACHRQGGTGSDSGLGQGLMCPGVGGQ